MRKTKIVKIVLGLSIASIVGVLWWGVHVFSSPTTGGVNYCGQCHTMEPLVRSHLRDVHAQPSDGSVQALCVDCHLPHDSQFQFYKHRILMGINDVWVEKVRGTSEINWEAKRAQRSKFVFDSGCLKCHLSLKQFLPDNEKSVQLYETHKAYFENPKQMSCVSCHMHVGHRDLGDELKVP